MGSTRTRLSLTAALLGALLLILGQAQPPANQPSGGGSATPQAGPQQQRHTPEGWFAVPPRSSGKAAPKDVRNAFVIQIHGMIDPALGDTVKRKVARCRAAGADMVIFDMSTPGGRSDVMDQIIRLILDDLKDPYVVAYVNSSAFSAGAIISLACDEIVMSPTGVIGDAMPILLGPQGVVDMSDETRAKVESAALAQIRMIATRNGYSPVLCEAMITIAREVWLIKNVKTGELMAVDAAQWRGRLPGAPATTQPAAAGPTEKDWKYLRTIVDSKSLATMTADEAVFLGFARGVVKSMDDLKERYNVKTAPTVLADTWSEDLVEFLTSAPVVGFLLFVGLLCAYVEAHTPGFGLAGSVAVACFALLFGSNYLIGLATWWEIGIFVLGLVMLGIELFVIPGFGVVGIAGLICCIVGLLAMIIPNAPNKWPIPRTDLDWSIFTNGLAALMVGFLMACAAAMLVARYLPKIPVASRLMLAAPEVVPSAPADDRAVISRISVGAMGAVEGTCRPVGQVRFGNDLIDAMAEGQFIPAGTKVRVIKVEGNRVVVAPVA